MLIFDILKATWFHGIYKTALKQNDITGLNNTTKNKKHVHKTTQTQVFILYFFITDKNWKQMIKQSNEARNKRTYTR